MDSIAAPLSLAQSQPAQTAGQLAVVWIVLAVVLVLLVAALVVGLVRARRRRVNLGADEPGQQPGQGYQGAGPISFSSGTGTGTAPRPEPPAPTAPAEPVSAEPASPTEPAEPSGAAPAGAGEPTSTEAGHTAPIGADTTAAPAEPAAQEPAEPAAPTAHEPAEPTGPLAPEASEPAPPRAPSEPAEPAAPTAHEPAEPTGPLAPEASEPAPPRAPSEPAEPAAPTAHEPAEPTGPLAPEASEPAPPRAPSEPAEPIAPPEGRLERLRGRLAGSRSSLGQGLLGLLGGGELDEQSWEEVEDTLLLADLGADTAGELIKKLRGEMASRGVRTPEQARQLLREVLTEALAPELDRSVRALPHDGRPAVVLVAGVNGTGKTTTTGKLARVLVASGRTVVLGAADTFRAAAVEQLATWGERAGAGVVRGKEGADPASVAFEAVRQAAAQGADTVLLDTAGRLHTKAGLMDELGKVKRVVSRQGEVDEVLLVLDATTGQNGVIQAKTFAEVVDVTGIVLTKLDGTAKGGIVFRVQRELGVPVKLVGLGEGPDDLAPFEPEAFVDALLG